MGDNGIFVAAMVTPKVSVSKIKPQAKSGNAKTRAILSNCFSLQKASHDVADVLVPMKILCPFEWLYNEDWLSLKFFDESSVMWYQSKKDHNDFK